MACVLDDKLLIKALQLVVLSAKNAVIPARCTHGQRCITAFFAEKEAIKRPRSVPLVDLTQTNAREKARGEGSSTPRKKYGLDLDTLECPLCAEPFSPPVFQCENGHTACSACCQKITNGCPFCSRPIGRIRCIAIEKVIESLHVECEHAHHGCKTTVKWSERAEHENKLCEYRPIQCPIQVRFGLDYDCAYKGPKATIPLHLTQEHDVQIVECSGPKTTASSKVEVRDLEAVMFKFKDAWLLVSYFQNIASTPGSFVVVNGFYCYSFGASKKVEYKLTVMPHDKIDRESKRIYSMQGVAHASEPDGKYNYLAVPGMENAFEITLSLD